MKTALALLTADELPARIMGAVATGMIRRVDLTTLCELVAQRARAEMREEAALAAGCDEAPCTYAHCSRADHLAARRIRNLPTSPADEKGRPDHG